mmetsp:Transcript_26259/g.65661  ORF Transcript_26259/g.65661 Transcript_26259/m.65661 type:complete len:96 (-) Transcript_26259:400-687(-)|eukprot:CAMPEP_0184724466 /NCGR_PEP_ID=MMETSP0314-20130426/27954_1 /TAXON_ID=38298 /ORGANISM="Rhodella maculata, Strain CCMP 736" /LENGTH=95 /DNA_ID=CAMNT_0027189463 /DNA_START=372 /DNA_END=659 /DNA_ORIENTATION=-
MGSAMNEQQDVLDVTIVVVLTICVLSRNKALHPGAKWPARRVTTTKKSGERDESPYTHPQSTHDMAKSTARQNERSYVFPDVTRSASGPGLNNVL